MNNFTQRYNTLNAEKDQIWNQTDGAVLLENRNSLLDNVEYAEKGPLFAAETAFSMHNKEEGFNKVLFDLLVGVRNLAAYQSKLEVRYHASFRTEKYIQDRNKKEDILQITKYISAISKEILQHPNMTTFNPPIFKGLIPIIELKDNLQNKAVFMLLTCAKDENFREFDNNSAYSAQLLNIATALSNTGNEMSRVICSIIDSGGF